jgi:hypothetical protein
MADTIVDGTHFDSNNVKYSAPKANAAGGKGVNIQNSLTNTGLRLSTPLMLTWGASDFEGNGKFELSMQFPSAEYPNEEASAFLKNMQTLEAKIKADALTNSKTWFGKVHTIPEVVNALWTPMLKYPKDKATGEPDLTKAPTLRVKVPIWDGVWKCEVYDEDENKLFPSPTPGVTPIEFMSKGTHLAAVLQCGGLWFANGKFGVTWKLIQSVVQRPKGSLTGQCLLKLKPSDKERLKTQAAPPAEDEVEVDSSALSAQVVDSDEESEDEDEEEEPASAPAPAPVPAPVLPPAPVVEVTETKKKKVVRKKAAGEA